MTNEPLVAADLMSGRNVVRDQTLVRRASVHQTLWPKSPPPLVWPAVAKTQRWSLSTPGEITWLRMHLRDHVLPPTGQAQTHEDDLDRLLLAFEELASNGLRHGRAPVAIAVHMTSEGWLIDVVDAATDRGPVPAVDRDPAHGGLGLHLVARLCGAHGWFVDTEGKHVWAYIVRRSP